MTDVPPIEGFLQQQLECSVCLSTYNLEDRIPKALKCQHTFCKQCLDTLAIKPPIACPKCKKKCDVENLVKNFALCDVLEKLCESCNSREIEARCNHCHQTLCATCLAIHDQIFQADVKRNLDELQQEVKTLSDLASDESMFDRERTRAAAAIEGIQKLEATLKNKIHNLQKINVENFTKWQQNIDIEVAKCKTFLRKSRHTLASSTEAQMSRESLTNMNSEALQFLSTLQEYHKSTPTPIGYTVVESQLAPDVREITSLPATSGYQATPADYTRARSVAVSGGQGSGPEEFAGDGYVTCTDHSYIVSDSDNHRLKVYGRDLNLMFVFGEEGEQKHQFNYPAGLCVSMSGELYVSDSVNSRIKVYDRYFQLVRAFGSRGSGDDQMKEPMGLAFTQTGQLLVADAYNYRVKVLGTDSSYIRSIGSKGQGPGHFRNFPVSVAATRTGHVLVNGANAAGLLMFTLTGVYVRDITPNVPDALKIWGFTTDCHDNIIIADRANHRLIVLDSMGQLTCVVGQLGNQPGKLKGPASVAVNSNKIVVYEHGNMRVQLFGM